MSLSYVVEYDLRHVDPFEGKYDQQSRSLFELGDVRSGAAVRILIGDQAFPMPDTVRIVAAQQHRLRLQIVGTLAAVEAWDRALVEAASA